MIDIAEGPGRDLKNIRQIGTPAEGDRIYIENADRKSTRLNSSHPK